MLLFLKTDCGNSNNVVFWCYAGATNLKSHGKKKNIKLCLDGTLKIYAVITVFNHKTPY